MNILIISPIYPDGKTGANFTKVVHYFAKEWKNIGHNVRVINLPSYFPKLFYYAPENVKKFIAKKFGTPLPDKQTSEIEEYIIEGIPVIRIPMFKIFPGTRNSTKILNNTYEIIHQKLQTLNYVPDVIVAHWTEPSLYFVDRLKKQYSVPTLVVSHLSRIKHFQTSIPSVDMWGYRSISCAQDLKKQYPEINFSFRCHSGIPEYFLEGLKPRNFEVINDYIYVGMMLPRKYPDVVIDIISELYDPDDNFSLELIGNGSMLDDLRDKVFKMNYQSKISLPGRIPREEIKDKLDKAQVFIMISKDEVYGLVYLEAMARGCITIASKGEGMDGIIEHGRNGFLIEAGNRVELKSIIEHIKCLSSQERLKISQNAIKTAQSYTNSKVALDYLNQVSKLVTNV